MAGSEHTKNTIRHHVYAVSKYFGIDPTNNNDMYMYAERLEQSIGISLIQATVSDSVKKLCENNPQAETFLKKYEELKLRNIRELSPSLFLLAKVKCDPEVYRALLLPLEQLSQARQLPFQPIGNLKSSEVTLERKGVSHLQQLIAESGPISGNNIQSISNQQLGNSVRLSAEDFGHLNVGSVISSHNSLRHNAQGDHHVLRSVASSVFQQLPKFPVQPEWINTRPTILDDFLPINDRNPGPTTIPIESLSHNVQEFAVVNDLLQCLQGNQGVYIKPLPLPTPYSVRLFTIDEKMTPALLDTVNKILPICSDYSTISRFVGEKSTYEYGLVNQALAAAMKTLLKDYLILICQLEHQYRIGQMGIARLQFFLQETATAFSHLARVAMDINTGGCLGGAVLSILYDSARAVYGVKQLHELMLYLLRSATVPFFKILQKWIFRGIIADPYKEFFIETGPMPEQPICGKNPSHLLGTPVHFDRFAEDYIDWTFFWERHYSIVSTNLPSFLEVCSYKVLNTGKYLNVVQQCADHFELPACEELVYNEDDPVYLNQIDQAYLYASSLLLKLMLKQKELKEHFKSVKRFFLLDQGDFIVHFMDSAASELRKPSQSVSRLRLGSLLETALRTSTANSDPFKDNLVVVISKYDLISQILMVLQAGSEDESGPLPIEDISLSGLEAFSLDYRVDWPVGLVLNGRVMDRYQMLFRHLLYCKHVERLLCNSWVLGKLARKSDSLMTTWFTTAFLLIQRMLTFIQHFQYYMSVEIIEPTWHNFFKQLDKVSNLDALLDSHLHCLEVCMDDCLLASPDLLSLVGKLCVACVTFSNFIQHLAISTTGLNISSDGNDVINNDPDLCVKNGERTFLHDPTPTPGLSAYSTSDFNKRSKAKGNQFGIHPFQESMALKVIKDNFTNISKSEDYAQTVLNYDTKFNALLVDFLEKLKLYSEQRNKLSSLVARLDFNEFYTEYAISHPPNLSSVCNISDLTNLRNQTAVISNTGDRSTGATFKTNNDFPSNPNISDQEDYI